MIRPSFRPTPAKAGGEPESTASKDRWILSRRASKKKIKFERVAAVDKIEEFELPPGSQGSFL